MRFLAGLLAISLLSFAVLMAPEYLLITGHEGDLIHTMDLVYRMAAGDRQHIETMTPLGVLTIWPIAVFVEAGFPPGRAVRLAAVAMCTAFLPMIWWVSVSRLEGVLRFAFAGGLVLLCTALVFGGDVPSISLSMYYNRWAWVLASLIVVVLFLPSRVEGGWGALLDGVVLGVCGAALVLIKATYVLALAPFVLVALAHDRRGKVLLMAGLAGLVCLALASIVLGGFAYWKGYLGDLLLTATSALRPQPGETFASLLAKPAFLPGTALLLLTIVYWRKTRLAREGLFLLILGPGLIYITYQNWGNDPKWLALLAVLLLARPNPEGAQAFLRVPARAFGQVLAVAALVMIAPSLINLASSPYRHLAMSSEGFAPLFTDLSRDDIRVRISTHRAPRTRGVLEGIVFGESYEAETTGEEADQTPKHMLNGERLPDCNAQTGLVGWQHQVAAQLGAVEEAVGQTVMTADLLDALWLFGPFERAAGGAPWYYGGEAGFSAADYILVPLCPLSTAARQARLDWMAEAGWALEEVLRTDLFILVKPAR